MSAAPEAPVEQPEKKGRRFGALFSKLNVLVFLVAVVGAEVIVAYFFVPSAGEVAAAAGLNDKDGNGHGDKERPAEKTDSIHDDPLAAEIAHGGEMKEIDLKQFTLTASKASSSSIWRIDFHLYGVVRKDDESEFLDLLSKQENRIRDHIGSIIRSADLAEVSDPGLGLLKRKILTKVNETLGKPLLRGVVFSEFSFIEQ
ncbi:MAG: flagellar basal body-associated FliL family protein [Planctomycetia bacterium]|nr:flagellar basal body-associated FliL family protein [Planctomycetia bacterium]